MKLYLACLVTFGLIAGCTMADLPPFGSATGWHQHHEDAHRARVEALRKAGY